MPGITASTLRKADWKQVYQYDGSSMSFVTYGCDALPGLTVTHEKRGPRKTRTYYRIGGRTTDSPTQAIRWYNAQSKANRQTGQRPPGSPQSSGLTDEQRTGLRQRRQRP